MKVSLLRVAALFSVGVLIGLLWARASHAQSRYVGVRDTASAIGIVGVGPDSISAIGNIDGRVFTLHAESDSLDAWSGELTWDGGLVDDVWVVVVAGMVRVVAMTRPPCIGNPICTHGDPILEFDRWFQ